MAVFAAALTGTQSSSGLVVTLVDTSNYTDNDEDYVVSDFTTRNFLIYDSQETLLETIELGEDLSSTYDITVDQMLTVVLELDGVAAFTDTITLPLRRITRNAYRTLLSKVGCCTSKASENSLMYADLFLTGADFEATSTNGAAFDEDISAAYSYLTN